MTISMQMNLETYEGAALSTAHLNVDAEKTRTTTNKIQQAHVLQLYWEKLREKIIALCVEQRRIKFKQLLKYLERTPGS